jgi:hypothetical protein
MALAYPAFDVTETSVNEVKTEELNFWDLIFIAIFL